MDRYDTNGDGELEYAEFSGFLEKVHKAYGRSVVAVAKVRESIKRRGLAAEDCAPGEENMCGRLSFSMYGTRDAALNWHQH